MGMAFIVREITAADADWVEEIVRGWGADFVVTRGRKVYPQNLAGFVAETKENRRVGLVTYEITGDKCEIVTLDALQRFCGIGTALVRAVKNAAATASCRRLWLITTNDNLEAMRFYQRRGFTIAAVHVNAIEHSRRLKPSIAKIGCFNIPIRDEIEFEVWL
jgi:N-acetylglutamate synthase-like GNAT family acetyltransferase